MGPEPPADTPPAEEPTEQLAPPPPPVPSPPGPVPPPFAGGNPWAAPPREFWINPRRRVPALIAGIVAALVLLAVGGVIGAAVSDHHDRRYGVFFEPGNGNDRMGPPFGPYGPNERVFPPQRPPRSATAPTPTPTPTPTKT